jgi:hypothetical protein
MTRSAWLTALALAGVLLAACSSQPSAGHAARHRPGHARAVVAAKVPASRYVVCQSIVGVCEGAVPKHEPSAVYFSADGSGYAKDITWTGWGTEVATGLGIAETDNCTPNCAQGKFSANPITITLTRPEPWHHDLVYSRAAISIPALRMHETFSAGLIPTPAPPVPGPTTPPAPGPVSNQATLTANCSMGYEPAYSANGSIGYGPFTLGTAFRDVTIGDTRYSPAVAYALTLTNSGTATAAVNGWVVAFYDAGGQELGSDQESFDTPTYLTAGQSLTWTEYSGTDLAGNGLYGSGYGTEDNSIPSTGTAATCQLVEWTHP